MKLFLSALTKFLFGILLCGLLIFLPAGTLSFGGGWLFMVLLFLPMLVFGAVLLVKAPKLLEKRLENREGDSAQKWVVAVSGLIFIAGFVLAGLDYRFSLSSVPVALTAVASVLFLLSYLMYAEVMRENAWLSRTVRVTEGQTVVDTGLYGIVRHPMYTATIVMFLSIPLILGSLWAFLLFFGYPIVIAVRVVNEEKLLRRELAGYEEYTKKVKYRLIPFVW